MRVADAEFVASAADAAGLPHDGLAHVAFVGRSNVGKSSLINALLGSRLARTSAAPGKTRLINLYRARVGQSGRLDLVDLPGYGYARGAVDGAFEALVTAYCETRERAAGRTLCVLMVDARHPGLDADRDAWMWLTGRQMDTTVVVTKIDKLTRAERDSHLRQFGALFHAPPAAVSAERGEGVDDLWQLIRNRLLP